MMYQKEKDFWSLVSPDFRLFPGSKSTGHLMGANLELFNKLL